MELENFKNDMYIYFLMFTFERVYLEIHLAPKVPDESMLTTLETRQKSITYILLENRKVRQLFKSYIKKQPVQAKTDF